MVPPRFMPEEYYNRFTLNGKIRVEYCYADDASTRQVPFIYDQETINAYVKNAEKRFLYYYALTDQYLYNALTRWPISGKEVAILGSETPWYESIALAFGAHPTTIDYNKIISQDPRIRSLSLKEYEQNPTQFDALISISSFEHDGLGRYGDPIHPDGDLIAMSKAKTMLKPGGLLFLAIPVGKDLLVWNSRRVYGSLRLPLLLAGWEVLETFGFSYTDCNLDLDGTTHQPLFLCRPIF